MEHPRGPAWSSKCVQEGASSPSAYVLYRRAGSRHDHHWLIHVSSKNCHSNIRATPNGRQFTTHNSRDLRRSRVAAAVDELLFRFHALLLAERRRRVLSFQGFRSSNEPSSLSLPLSLRALAGGQDLEMLLLHAVRLVPSAPQEPVRVPAPCLPPLARLLPGVLGDRRLLQHARPVRTLRELPREQPRVPELPEGRNHLLLRGRLPGEPGPLRYPSCRRGPRSLPTSRSRPTGAVPRLLQTTSSTSLRKTRTSSWQAALPVVFTR